MESLKAGDWVRTKDGREGEIILVSRLSAFVKIEGHDEMRSAPLPAERTDQDRPTASRKLIPSQYTNDASKCWWLPSALRALTGILLLVVASFGNTGIWSSLAAVWFCLAGLNYQHCRPKKLIS